MLTHPQQRKAKWGGVPASVFFSSVFACGYDCLCVRVCVRMYREKESVQGAWLHPLDTQQSSPRHTTVRASCAGARGRYRRSRTAAAHSSGPTPPSDSYTHSSPASSRPSHVKTVPYSCSLITRLVQHYSESTLSRTRFARSLLAASALLESLPAHSVTQSLPTQSVSQCLPAHSVF